LRVLAFKSLFFSDVASMKFIPSNLCGTLLSLPFTYINGMDDKSLRAGWLLLLLMLLLLLLDS